MMLLSAVLLIFAFLALSAMVARVAQLGSVTTQDRDRPVLLEIDVVQDAIDETVSGLATAAPAGAGLSKQNLVDSLTGALDHLVHLEANRGFDLQWSLVDASTGAPVAACGPDPVAVQFTLDDGEVRVSLRSSSTFVYAC